MQRGAAPWYKSTGIAARMSGTKGLAVLRLSAYMAVFTTGFLRIHSTSGATPKAFCIPSSTLSVSLQPSIAITFPPRALLAAPCPKAQFQVTKASLGYKQESVTQRGCDGHERMSNSESAQIGCQIAGGERLILKVDATKHPIRSDSYAKSQQNRKGVCGSFA